MTDTHPAAAPAPAQPLARNTTAETGEAYWFFDSLMVIRADQPGQPVILLSDGAGLTARQCATLLARAGHRVEALSPDPLCLCRLTRHVRAVHRVPGFGADPFGWLDAALDIAARRGAELLLPVQEQVSVMALAREHVMRLGALLGWHGALSADVIVSAQGPQLIDINPRLVEPVNAYLSGADLVGTLVEVARSGTARVPEAGARDRQGVRTHQLLLAVPAITGTAPRS
jgi:hypothetical protein